jgi:hypothetical protein
MELSIKGRFIMVLQNLLFSFIICFPLLSIAGMRLSDQRLAEIEKIAAPFNRESLLTNVTFIKSLSVPGPAWTKSDGQGHFTIEVNPDILSQLSQTSADLIYFHELGHVHLKHLPLLQQHPEMAEICELEADAFSAFVFRKLDVVDQPLIDFLKFTKTQGTKPSGEDRIRIYSKILNIQGI